MGTDIDDLLPYGYSVQFDRHGTAWCVTVSGHRSGEESPSEVWDDDPAKDHPIPYDVDFKLRKMCGECGHPGPILAETRNVVMFLWGVKWKLSEDQSAIFERAESIADDYFASLNP